MRSVKLAFIGLTLGFASFVYAAGRIPSEIALRRDLRLYDDGGIYMTPIGEPDVTGAKSLRRFIWSHWSEERRGYVIVVKRDKGSGERCYLFIEPSGGRWHIAWHSVDYSNLPEEWPPRALRDISGVERCRDALIFFDAKDRVVTTL